MNSIYNNNDIFEYILHFLPNMTSITYKSDTIINDINTISNISLVSKTFYNHSYQDFYKKEKNYNEFLRNSYHLREVCKKFRMDKEKKKILLASEYNFRIAEFAFKYIYKKHNIVKKRNSLFHNNFSSSNRHNITFTNHNNADHIIIIYDFLELGILAVEQKHTAIIQKLKDIHNYYTVLPQDIFKKYTKYILDVTTTQRFTIFCGYSENTKQLLKVSIWSLLFTIIHINHPTITMKNSSKLYEAFTKKKLEFIEELKNLSGKNRNLPKKFCKSLIEHYENF